MTHLSATAFRNLLMVCFVLLLYLTATFYDKVHVGMRVRNHIVTPGQPLPIKVDSSDEGSSVTEGLSLTEKECRDTFPDLFADLDYATQRPSMILEKDDGDYKGLVQGWIKNNKLSILSTAPDTDPQILHQRTAILSQLHRAILTSPSHLPDTPFAFVVNDNPRNNSWVFSRPNKHSTYNILVIPSFAFWSWPSATLSTFDDIMNRITTVERRTPWENKADKAIWRGTPWFNSPGHPTLRQDLLKATRNREWADVASLNKSGDNALAIEDFCGYKYIVYTEGVTYGGRLPYHQACGSVLITAPLMYLTHTAWLVRPIALRDLLGAFDSGGRADALPSAGGVDGVAPALLPTVRDWRLANAIYVSPKFDDLEEVVMFLRAHPRVARQIARNQREVAKQRYLGSAAETCYWRALIRASASVLEAGAGWQEERRERYETWLLRQVTGVSDRLRKTGS